MNKDEKELEEMNISEEAEASKETEEAEVAQQEAETEEAGEAAESEESNEAEGEKEEKKSKTKGNQAALFSKDTVTAFSAVANSEEMEHKYRNALASRMAIVMAILTVIATALRLLNFNVPIIPAGLNMDFSSLPEVIASIAYGPIFGVIIVVIKNLIYIAIKIKSLSVPSIITNIVLDTLFVYITGAHYSRKMFPLDPEDRPVGDWRRLFILGGGAIGSGVAAVSSFFLAYYVTYPILFKNYTGYTEEYIIYVYQQALDRLNAILPGKLGGIVNGIVSLKRGILIYNVPHTFFKYFIVAVIAAVIYNFLSPVLHFRNNMMPEEEEEEYEYQQQKQVE